ncbi:hypothetical protein [Sphingorhabdus sp. SMR4y]|nr:hypothetical protein [Sphingorhabdus sp. SMR4y]ASK86796.1 hypothetical protein SPHFLASMR4Y_00002 [Sphingorhabdus sp. SMR4y]
MLSPKAQNRFAAAFASLVSAAVLLSASIGPAVNNSASLVI